MTEPQRPHPRAGGVIIAVTTLAGLVAGTAWRQPSAGIVAGIAAGLVAALVLWLVDRRRR